MGNDAAYYKMALDLGAQGVIVPMIESGQDAKRAAEYCRYPPLGTRGFSPMRASMYFRNIKEYIGEANEEILLVAQIESVKAVQHVEAIAGTEGIDAVFIGPGDLSSSMNLIGQLTHPKVQETIDQVIATIRSCGVPFGIPTTSPEEFAHFVERGATLLTVGGDIPFLREGADHCLKERKAWLAANGPAKPQQA
jgi:2-keto-3-deoxy-L-rhamnonate aldolase RhmA